MPKTCFVVGAGGSCAYGLPNGPRLVQMITELSRADGGTFANFQDKRIQSLGRLQQKLLQGDPDSIDQFVLKNKDFYDAASFAVALILLNCHYKFKPTLNHEDDWLRVVFNRHVDAFCHATQDPDVSFVTYNYDTLIENFIERKLNAYMSRQAARARAQCVKVTHLHGQLGSDVEIGREFEAASMLFAGMPGEVNRCAANAADQLRFYWDDDDADDNAWEAAVTQMKEAERIVVVGVGQATGPLNELVYAAFEGAPSVEVFATTYGMSDHQVGDLLATLGDATTDGLKARQFLETYVYT